MDRKEDWLPEGPQKEAERALGTVPWRSQGCSSSAQASLKAWNVTTSPLMSQRRAGRLATLSPCSAFQLWASFLFSPADLSRAPGVRDSGAGCKKSLPEYSPRVLRLGRATHSNGTHRDEVPNHCADLA